MTDTVRAQRRKHHYIYKITSTVDGKYYIGLHSTDNLDDGYFGSGQQLKRSIAKHGRHTHSLVILSFHPTRELLKEEEKRLVNRDTIRDPMCLNLALGGNGPGEVAESTRAKLSALHTGRKRSEETKARMSAAAKLRVATMKDSGRWEEVKAKNAAAHSGKPQTAETIAKRIQSVQAYKDANGGHRTFSEQARLNISQGQRGKKRGPYKPRMAP